MPAAVLALAAAASLAWLSAAERPACAPPAHAETTGPRSAAPGAVPAAPRVKARSGILVRRDTGEVLWRKNAAARLAPASCTKIMTALLALERYPDLERQVRAPRGVAGQQKVGIGLRPGDRITVRQALRALLVKSANDAALTLAVAVAGSEARFVRRMNRRAAQLGLDDSRFRNSRGKDQTGHRMSARDLAQLARYVWLKFPAFRSIVKTRTAVIAWPPAHRVKVTSHNRLLGYRWGDGVKTGSTRRARRVLVGSGTPSGVPLIVVTMREATRDREEKDAVALLKWGAALVSAQR
ncbi:MAG TPA: serine hydrolase [Thermoleophilia bacterium]|nr:serine hydrolase [Acidobacteriota bacterium]HQH21094.1 serine hydrolase [Thermoleophilia bacterium]